MQLKQIINSYKIQVLRYMNITSAYLLIFLSNNKTNVLEYQFIKCLNYNLIDMNIFGVTDYDLN